MTNIMRLLGRGTWTVVILIVLAVAVLPFFFMTVTSIQNATTVSLSFNPANLDLGNYTRLFTDHGFGPAILTSVIVVILAILLNLFVASLAAFAFEKKPFPGSEVIFVIYIVSMMVPVQVTLIPLFTIMKDLGLLNSYLSLALPLVGAFGVFLIRQFLVTLPDELMEAARLDGASDLRIFVTIILPLVRPVLVALTVFTFISTWNDFLWPLVSISDNQMQTVTLAAANMVGNLTKQYGLIMAGSMVTFIVPLVLYLFLQRQFVEGVATSGLKG
jgi:multiple sugar transport system permease protein